MKMIMDLCIGTNAAKTGLFYGAFTILIGFSALFMGLGIAVFSKCPLYLENGLIDQGTITIGTGLICAALVAAFFSYLVFDVGR